LFPEISAESIGNSIFEWSEKQAEIFLAEIEQQFSQTAHHPNQAREKTLAEIEFLHLKGRFLIRRGDYTQGQSVIRRVIEQSLQFKHDKYAIKGFLQLIFLYIQTQQTEPMGKAIESAMNIAAKPDFLKERGTLLRLKGLHAIMNGHYHQAETYLHESLQIFSNFSEHSRFSLIIAAIYNYLGEIQRIVKNYSAALDFFQKAIALSKDHQIISSLAVFYCHAGQTALEMTNFKTAEKYLKAALKLYRQYDFQWQRPTAEACYAWLKVKQNRPALALKYIKKAEQHSLKLKNPQELHLISQIKREIFSLL
jgi:tetratricopeptide (TPR) repeat protein